MKQRTLNKRRKISILFYRYDRNKKGYLTKKEMMKLMNKEYNLNYDKNIINSLMNIWGSMKSNQRVIMKDTFPKLFNKPDGFLRDHKI